MLGGVDHDGHACCGRDDSAGDQLGSERCRSQRAHETKAVWRLFGGCIRALRGFSLPDSEGPKGIVQALLFIPRARPRRSVEYPFEALAILAASMHHRRRRPWSRSRLARLLSPR